MEFKEGAEVLAPRGRKIGRVDRVVVNPATGEVTHLVVKRGWLFTTDKVIAIGHVDFTTENQVLLKKSAAPDDYPDFEKTEYIPTGGYEDFRERKSEAARRVLWYHTRISIPWWGAGPDPARPKPLFVKRTRRNIPEGAVALDEGAPVIDSEGFPVGEVTNVYTEPEEHRVTHIQISRGVLARGKKLIPTAWVEDIFENSVRLTVGKAVVADLPDLPEPAAPAEGT
jgi:uncharacterized protein YrrD